jgi:hypothetical protein
LIVELADEPPTGGDDLGTPCAPAGTTGTVTRRRALAPDARTEIRLVKRVGQQPQQERAGADGTRIPRGPASRRRRHAGIDAAPPRARPHPSARPRRHHRVPGHAPGVWSPGDGARCTAWFRYASPAINAATITNATSTSSTVTSVVPFGAPIFPR